ncbi:MAG: hypothetical protein V4495_15815, partial [Pseudomonadota bacterium]
EILSLRRQRTYSKKGDPGIVAPAGFPFVQYKKWESPKTRLRLKHRPFFFHFLYNTNGVDTWERQKSKATPPPAASHSPIKFVTVLVIN